MAVTMKKIIYLVISVLLFVAGKILLQGDYIAFLQWWAVVAGLGLIFLPITCMLFGRFHDKGYLFSKVLGIAFVSYLMWLLSSVKLMRFTPLSCIICVAFGLLLNVLLFLWQQRNLRKKRKQHDNLEQRVPIWKNRTLDVILVEEILFFGVFLLFTYIRCFKPEAYGTEKFMDYGFMTSMMRSEYMPPQDFWFSGTKLNYYYVGQYMAVFLTKLSFVKVADAYNLMLMMVGAFALVLPYSLGYNVILQFIKNRESKSRMIPVLGGILSGAGVCIAGNMHYPIFQWLEPAVRKFFGIEPSDVKYWFPDATRYIGYHPETTDKTIHEFPAYSFVLGDLHAHVINIMLVLSVLGILFAWLIDRQQSKEQSDPVLKEIFHPAIIAISFLIGLFHMTNFWDFPIYYVVSGAVILFSNLIVYNFKGKALWLTALQGITVYLISEVVCLPFTLNFDQISTNLCLTESRTPLNQLIILWGLPIYVVICFIAALVTDHRKVIKSTEEVKKPVFLTFLSSLSASDLFILVLGLCAIGLVLLPELVYIQDIYSGEYKRANTMFKLTYQAFIMFGLCFGYILLRLLCYGRTKTQRRQAFFGMLLFLISLTYIQNAVNAWYGNIYRIEGKRGLDASAFMETTMPEDALAASWLNEHISGMPVVLEANGDSYSDYQRVSVITGLPTVLGWHTHEWLWKSDSGIVDARAADIEAIYTSLKKAGEDGDTYTSLQKNDILALLKKYDVSYIYVGKLEQEKYSEINQGMLKSLGEVVFEIPAAADGEYDTYIVKVKYE